jgi:hypothetical protein
LTRSKRPSIKSMHVGQRLISLFPARGHKLMVF